MNGAFFIRAYILAVCKILRDFYYVLHVRTIPAFRLKVYRLYDDRSSIHLEGRFYLHKYQNCM